MSLSTNNVATCLVTGAAGFVGSHLVERLLNEGHEVIGVDNFFSGFEENVAPFADHARFRFYEKDIREEGLIAELLGSCVSPVYVFHLAAIVSVPYCMENQGECEAVNKSAAIRLYNDAQGIGATAFIFAGSAAEYGDVNELPVPEYTKGLPIGPYGQNKADVTQHICASGWGASLRFFNIYGPRQNPSSPYSGVVSKFVDRALGGDSIVIHGDGRQSRDFVYVADAVQAYILAAGMCNRDDKPLNGVFNVGCGADTTIRALADIIMTAVGKQLPIEYEPARANDILFSRADIDKLTATGFRPSISLLDGIRLTIDWIKGSTAPHM